MSPNMMIIMNFSLITGTLITISSSHWLLAWVGLEISTFAILPLLTQKYSPRAMEATTKYFIVQATATTMLLFATISNVWMLGQWDIQQMGHPISFTMISIAIALKLGLAPMHAWFPEVLQGLSLPAGLILSTWQKIAPLALMLQLSPNNLTMMTYLGLLSIIVGGWGGLNQTQLRKILGYSSIAHLGWMALIIKYSPALTFLAFNIYVILTMTMFLTFWYNKTNSINMLSTSWVKTPILSSISPLILLSLGGLPPLTGFLPKWMIISELINQELVLTTTIASIATLLSLYFYLRLSYAMTFITPPNNLPATLPWRIYFLQTTTPLSISTMLSLCLLPLYLIMLSL
uniref:NADH-ubiquinone oxidoreductase chain 2 n=1 Tax=Moema staecki TaxID=61825 RepID=Q9TD18_9TELE|nr:NADH dehydrogenase subunit II [Moema staecki]